MGGRLGRAGFHPALLRVALGLAALAPGAARGEQRPAAPGPSALPAAQRLPALEARLVGVVLQHLAGAGLRAPERDPRLDEAARQNCLDLADRPAGAPAPPAGEPAAPSANPTLDPARLQYLLGQSGVPDAAVLPLALSGAEPSLARGLERALAQPLPGGSPPPTHFGLAALRVGDRGPVHATVLLLHRLVQLEPLPRRVEPGQAVLVRGELQGEAESARLLVCGPPGTVQEVALAAAARRFEGVVPFADGKGAYHLQLLAETAQGPVVAASLPLYVGVEPPPGPVVQLLPPASAGASPETVEQQVLELIDRDRRRQGLPPLRRDPVLALAARQHSEQMRDRHFFSHLTPERVRPEERLRELGLRPEREAENIAIAADGAQAHALLMASPSHRRNLLDPELTQVGLGAAWDRGPVRSLFLTEIFARLPRR